MNIFTRFRNKKRVLVYAGDLSIMLVDRESAGRLNPILEQHLSILPRYWNILTGLSFAFDNNKVMVFSQYEETMYLSHKALRLLEDRYCHDLGAVRRLSEDALARVKCLTS